jgi:D-glycero-alpha-D-manno-heptose 1-phosphate guanylyltransferase
MNAIILAGGFGKRLQSVINDVPKPMAPVGNKPFLAHLLDYLIEQGIEEVVLSLHYLSSKITHYFGAVYRNLPIRYVIEETPLGTGGAITYALSTTIAMYRQHTHRNSLMTMAVTPMLDCSRYGEVVLAGNKLTHFIAAGSKRCGFINAGVYLLSAAALHPFTLPKQFSFEHDFLYQSAVLSHIDYFKTEDFFIDIGIPEDYHRFCDEMLIT